MFRRLICKMGEPELAYPAKPLELSRIDKTPDQFASRSVGFQPDDIMYRIAVNSLGHCLSPAKNKLIC